jgi:hypothetical protein
MRFGVVRAHNQQAFYMFKRGKKLETKNKGCLLYSYLYGSQSMPATFASVKPVSAFPCSFFSSFTSMIEGLVSRQFQGATTFSIATLGMMTFSINGLFVTISINDIQHL